MTNRQLEYQFKKLERGLTMLIKYSKICHKTQLPYIEASIISHGKKVAALKKEFFIRTGKNKPS